MLRHTDGSAGLGELCGIPYRQRLGFRRQDTFFDLDAGVRLGVVSHQPHKHRPADLLGKLERKLGQLVGLCHRARFQHGHIRHKGKASGVLLAHTGGHTRIVCYIDDQTALTSRISDTDQRVIAHVQTGHLHGAQRTASRQCSTGCHLKRCLFVGTPFHVGSRQIHLQQTGNHFCGGGARITADHLHAGTQSAIGNGFVSADCLFHLTLPPLR